MNMRRLHTKPENRAPYPVSSRASALAWKGTTLIATDDEAQ
ncbi:hypothetical protein BURPS1710A_A2644 [Burkholderia pseudomallei 1710a]|uniref:Uncharacterized protein n=1 Tax=Burkholderia pseudomallei 1710a TaxID=320371 RepID=A0A0E1VTD7_BURPE|nr:hypothetical protein BURPS1710A_A2644 [Burkholderia pseudomallei 1710a]